MAIVCAQVTRSPYGLRDGLSPARSVFEALVRPCSVRPRARGRVVRAVVRGGGTLNERSSSWKQGRARSTGLLATIHTRAREICGILSCTSMHFQALSCNGRLPKGCKIKYFASKKGTHNAGVEGSSPSLSTNQISVIPRQGEFASPP